MDHDPKEIEAIVATIGKLYGYNTTAMARGVLDALKPFREAQVADAVQAVIGVAKIGLVGADYSATEMRILASLASLGAAAIPITATEKMQLERNMTELPTHDWAGKTPTGRYRK